MAFRNLALAALAAGLVSGGPAQAQIRLHSSSEEELTNQLVSELEKARTGHLAALDTHRSYLTVALAREQSLLVQRELAERDALLAVILSAKSRGADPVELLGSQIDQEWTETTGLPATSLDSSIPLNARFVASLEVERSGLRRQRARLIAMFEAAGGKGSYCDPDGVGPAQFTVKAELPEAQALDATCEELATNARELKSRYGAAGTAAALLGDSSSPIHGQFGEARREAAEAEALAKAQEALVKTVAAQVKALDAYYQCELARVSLAQAIRADAAAVQGALNALAAGTGETVFSTETFRSAWHILRSQKIDPDCTAPAPADPAPEAPPASSFSADQILSAIRALDNYGAEDAVLALVRESALDVQGSILGEALIGLAAAPGTTPDSAAARRAAAALRLFGNLEQLYRASNNRLPDVSGVLVALADVRMRQAVAKIEAGRLAGLHASSRQRLAAVRQRALLLADARAALEPKTDAALAASMRRYAESVNRGSLPAAVLANAMVKGRYLPWLDREKAVVEASYAMLAPAAAQLQAYGKGGITPDTIAQFLQALGLGGIAIK